MIEDMIGKYSLGSGYQTHYVNGFFPDRSGRIHGTCRGFENTQSEKTKTRYACIVIHTATYIFLALSSRPWASYVPGNLHRFSHVSILSRIFLFTRNMIRPNIKICIRAHKTAVGYFFTSIYESHTLF
jgi:hypothetical protein